MGCSESAEHHTVDAGTGIAVAEDTNKSADNEVNTYRSQCDIDVNCSVVRVGDAHASNKNTCANRRDDSADANFPSISTDSYITRSGRTVKKPARLVAEL